MKESTMNVLLIIGGIAVLARIITWAVEADRTAIRSRIVTASYVVWLVIKRPLIGLCGLAAIYWLVRFIKWSWEDKKE